MVPKESCTTIWQMDWLSSSGGATYHTDIHDSVRWQINYHQYNKLWCLWACLITPVYSFEVLKAYPKLS